MRDAVEAWATGLIFLLAIMIALGLCWCIGIIVSAVMGAL